MPFLPFMNKIYLIYWSPRSGKEGIEAGKFPASRAFRKEFALDSRSNRAVKNILLDPRRG